MGKAGLRQALLENGLRLLSDGSLQAVVAAATRAQGKGYTLGVIDREVRNCLNLLTAAGVEPRVVLDVGANVGNWTAALLERRSPEGVWLFEPSQAAYDAICARFADRPDVHCVRTGLGATSSRVNLRSDHPGSPLGTIYERPVLRAGDVYSFSETVDIATLDSMVGETVPSPDLVKMDVEGMELEVLAGATLTLDRVSVIQFEFGGTNVLSRTFFKDFWELLVEERGFSIFRDTNRGLRLVEHYDYSYETFATTNYWSCRLPRRLSV